MRYFRRLRAWWRDRNLTPAERRGRLIRLMVERNRAADDAFLEMVEEACKDSGAEAWRQTNVRWWLGR